VDEAELHAKGDLIRFTMRKNQALCDELPVSAIRWHEIERHHWAGALADGGDAAGSPHAPFRAPACADLLKEPGRKRRHSCSSVMGREESRRSPG